MTGPPDEDPISDHEIKKLRLLSSIRFGIALIWASECASRSPGSLTNLFLASALCVWGLVSLYWDVLKPWVRACRWLPSGKS